MSATTAAAAAPLKGKVGVEEGEQARVHKIRITLSSRNVKNLEKGAALLSWFPSPIVASILSHFVQIINFQIHGPISQIQCAKLKMFYYF